MDYDIIFFDLAVAHAGVIVEQLDGLAQEAMQAATVVGRRQGLVGIPHGGAGQQTQAEAMRVTVLGEQQVNIFTDTVPRACMGLQEGTAAMAQ